MPRQCTGWKAVFPARSASMAAHATMDITAGEMCSLCGTCLNVIRRKISECSAVECSELLSEPVKELLGFSSCELLLLEAVS
jgi:hypothetical protein